jgi:hypothetical protein
VITREAVGQKIDGFLHHRMSLEELVDWAEEAMSEGEFEEEHLATIREVVSRLGVSDVRAFGLTWKDCEEMLERLGYQVRVEVTKK